MEFFRDVLFMRQYHIQMATGHTHNPPDLMRSGIQERLKINTKRVKDCSSRTQKTETSHTHMSQQERQRKEHKVTDGKEHPKPHSL
jgi:hypothetical protein